MTPTDAELQAAAVLVAERALRQYTTGPEFGDDYAVRSLLASITNAGIYLDGDSFDHVEKVVQAVKPAFVAMLRQGVLSSQRFVDAYTAAGYKFHAGAPYYVNSKV